jgi:hypothetical protein
LKSFPQHHSLIFINSFDDILFYPSEMQFRALQKISESIGLKQDMVRKIDSNWHSRIKEKIFNKPTIE